MASVGTRMMDWLDERTGLRALLRGALEEEVPGGARLRYIFGSVLTYLFMQQVVLGILLAFYYSPSASDAWASTAFLNDQVSGGWFLRGLHHHGSSAMVVVTVFHLLQVVIAGAYRKPREINWWTGLMMGGLVLAFALTGYLLPWDQKGYWATQVATGIMGSVPGGEPLQGFVQGGHEYGNLTLTRFYALHVFVLPISLAALLGVHLLVFRRHGVTPPATLSDEELARTSAPFWPSQLFLDVLAMFVCGAALIGLTYSTHGAELFAPADPASNFVARPEWYFLFLFQLLKYFEGPLQIIATVLLPGAAAIFLFALPWIDRAPTRRVRQRIGVLTGVGVLMAGAVALTALAIVEDGGKPHVAESLEQAHKDAEKSRALAKKGVPPAGGVAVWENDPEFQVRALFRENCATCHTLGGVGGEEAPSFDGYASREWIAGLLRAPTDKRFYGGTKHSTMEPVKPEDVSDEQLSALVEYVYSLMGPDAAPVDAALVTRGKALWDDTLDCSGCHEVDAGKESAGPTLANRASLAWIERIIRDSSAADLYGDTAEMPKFAGKLADAEVHALAELVARQRLLAEGRPDAVLTEAPAAPPKAQDGDAKIEDGDAKADAKAEDGDAKVEDGAAKAEDGDAKAEDGDDEEAAPAE